MISRRSILATTTLAGPALIAAPVLLRGISSPALAKAPIVGSQGPSFYRYKLGDFEIIALHDGDITRPLDANFVRNAPIEAVKKVLSDAFLPDDKIPFTFTALLINTGSKVVLIDTGFNDNGSPMTGKIASSMKAAGIEPSMVDTVILSHFHGDHLQGLRNKAGELVYPNAEIMVPEAEWAFWMDDARMAAAPDAMKGAFQGVRRVLAPSAKDVKQFKWDQEIVPGITTVDASGHTPGHTAFVIASGNARMMYVGDLTHTPVLFATNPEWKVMFDMDADKAVGTRKRILDMAMTEKLRLSFFHASFPATGFITKEGTGYRFVAAHW